MEEKLATHGYMATNDQLESSLGGTTRGIELGGMINMAHAAGQSNMKRN